MIDREITPHTILAFPDAMKLIKEQRKLIEDQRTELEWAVLALREMPKGDPMGRN